jgi:hypothetical protein
VLSAVRKMMQKAFEITPPLSPCVYRSREAPAWLTGYPSIGRVDSQDGIELDAQPTQNVWWKYRQKNSNHAQSPR